MFIYLCNFMCKVLNSAEEKLSSGHSNVLSRPTHQITRPGQALPRASNIRHSGNICQDGESKRYRFNSHKMNNACSCIVGNRVRVRASKYGIKIVLKLKNEEEKSAKSTGLSCNVLWPFPLTL